MRCIEGTVVSDSVGEDSLMNYVHIGLLVFIGLLLPASRYLRSRWVPITLAAVFLFLQVSMLTWSLDLRVRGVTRVNLEEGRAVQHASETAVAIKHAQFPVRVTIAILGLGLFVVVCCWSGLIAPTPSLRRDSVGPVR